MKVGIIRCEHTEDICPGSRCLDFSRTGQGAFEELGSVETIGLVSCGGCPGKKAVARAMQMEKRGAEVIFLASCMTKGIPWDFPCPHWETIKESLGKKLKKETRVIDWTHE